MKGFSTIVDLIALISTSVVSSWNRPEQTAVGGMADVTPNHVITPAVVSFVQDKINHASISGLSMGVVRLTTAPESGPLVELDAWGNKSEDGDALTPDTLFAIASCSKAFLVTSVGLLIDDYEHRRNTLPLPLGLDALNWDTKIKDLLPDEFGLSDKWAESKTSLRDALSHMSGMSRHEVSYRPGDTTADVVRKLKTLSPAYELREQWLYNNQMYMLVAHLVSRLTNMSYPTFVQSRLFGPLGMSTSSFSPSAASATGKLTQAWTRAGRRIPFWFTDETAELFGGAGGVISSVEDMADAAGSQTKWLAFLLKNGTNPGSEHTNIPSSIIKEMTTAHAVVTGAAKDHTSIVGYGMGWFRMSYRGHDVVWHPGDISGFSLLTAFLPSDNLGVVLLANMDDVDDENFAILYRVIDEALELPPINYEKVTSPLSSAESHPETPDEYDPKKPLSLNLGSYAGEYEDATYGKVTLCTQECTSAYCTSVLKDFAAVDQAQPFSHATSSAPTLFASWPAVWASHMRMRHTSGESFYTTFPVLFPRGYGRDSTPFQTRDGHGFAGRTEFVVEDGKVTGFALITEESAASARAKHTRGTPREVADAWFARVQ